MVILIIFPVILQTDINVIMLSIGGQGHCVIHPDRQTNEQTVTQPYSSAK